MKTRAEGHGTTEGAMIGPAHSPTLLQLSGRVAPPLQNPHGDRVYTRREKNQDFWKSLRSVRLVACRAKYGPAHDPNRLQLLGRVAPSLQPSQETGIIYPISKKSRLTGGAHE